MKKRYQFALDWNPIRCGQLPQPLNLTSAYTCIYDAWNRLVEVKSGGSTIATYQYDGSHRRTLKLTTGGTVTGHYYYSDQWQVLEERLGTSSTADRQFVWGLRYVDDLVLRDRGSERLYAVHDFFNVTAIISTTGAVQERYGYDAYGTSRVMDATFNSASSSYDWETRFGAYRWDSDTGLSQVRHRYLHPNVGRWLSRDPSNYEDGSNLYHYVAGNPLNLVDPTGLCFRVVLCNWDLLEPVCFSDCDCSERLPYWTCGCTYDCLTVFESGDCGPRRFRHVHIMQLCFPYEPNFCPPVLVMVNFNL